MVERFTKRRHIRRIAGLAYILSSLLYLAWRLTIFNEHAMVLSTMYFVADVFAVVLGVLAVFVSWNYRHREPVPAPPGLKVDVLIPVFKEPLDMVRRTVEGACAIRYPHETWLLDDAKRPELRALATELGCHYLARQTNDHAKAGNLNHALKAIKGDFVAVFDADHIPQPHALDLTLGFFTDPKVAMVQTPQDYFNIDALQYSNNEKNGGLWHDQSFFYNISQPGRDFFDAASCAGTSVVYRRSALDVIGGFPTETVTEDVHTSLKLHKRGFSAPFLNEPIAYGIAAADLADYYRTRQRYGHGNIHALRIENVFFCKGLTIGQRLSYLFLGLIYLEGWQQLLVFLVPSIALIFGIAPFDISVFNVLVVLSFPLWTYALMQEIGCGFSRYWTNEIFAMIRWPVHIISSVALFKDKLVWRSSRKNVKGRVDWALLAPQLAVIVLSLTALTLGVWRLAGDFATGPLIGVLLERIPDGQAIVSRWNWLASEVQAIAVGLVSPGQDVAAGGADAVAVAPPPPLFTVPAKPIDWFQPLTTGYTLDLVLVAGFWALINALRGIFVVFKVVRNARHSRDDYAFRCLVPVEIQIGESKALGVAERLSGTEIRFPRALRRRLDRFRFPLAATIFLPTGPVCVRLLKPRSPGDPFLPIDVRPERRREIEACLYAVSWHRDFLHHSAEFGTPFTALARLFRFRGSQAAVGWQEAGLAWPRTSPTGSDGAAERQSHSLQPVILQGHRRSSVAETMIAFQPLNVGGSFVVNVGADGESRSRTVRIEKVAEERILYPNDSETSPRSYRYRIADLTPVRPKASLPRRLYRWVMGSRGTQAGTASSPVIARQDFDFAADAHILASDADHNRLRLGRPDVVPSAAAFAGAGADFSGLGRPIPPVNKT
ncbi:glycosyltransferase [Mesorhizobium sp. KR9-304]|uniref:glycosyltransferase family 2 protein n=1 Tax=Mesorhizobium sp. KR9-304 TaxID=3156614 RepID=UPI0032B575C5